LDYAGKCQKYLEGIAFLDRYEKIQILRPSSLIIKKEGTLETFPKHKIKKKRKRKSLTPSKSPISKSQSPSLKIKKEGTLETFPKYKRKRKKKKKTLTTIKAAYFEVPKSVYVYYLQ